MTSGHGARVEEIAEVRAELGPKLLIKIDGGVKTLSHAVSLLEAGAARIGLTATKAVAGAAGQKHH
jgi:deoxyribose-phosphate aldolase